MFPPKSKSDRRGSAPGAGRHQFWHLVYRGPRLASERVARRARVLGVDRLAFRGHMVGPQALHTSAANSVRKKPRKKSYGRVAADSEQPNAEEEEEEEDTADGTIPEIGLGNTKQRLHLIAFLAVGLFVSLLVLLLLVLDQNMAHVLPSLGVQPQDRASLMREAALTVPKACTSCVPPSRPSMPPSPDMLPALPPRLPSPQTPRLYMPPPCNPPPPPGRPPPSLPPAAPAPVCLGNLHAIHVQRRNEGRFGTTDPVLWVYEGQGQTETVQKSKVQSDTLEPKWEEVFCVSIATRDDPRVCFDIRDDFDPAFPIDAPPLLHFGCVTSESLTSFGSWERGAVEIQLTHGATLFIDVQPTLPAPPPLPPALPHPPTPPPSMPSPPLQPKLSVLAQLNLRFALGGYTNNLTRAGVMIHQFDGLDDPDPNGQPWMPGLGRRDVSDRISAALIYGSMARDKPGNLPLYSFDLGGIILNPEHNHLLCSHPGDVGSIARKCPTLGGSATCTPGCTVWDGADTWCDPSLDRLDWPFFCTYPPSRLADAMEIRDNLGKRGDWYDHKMWQDGKFYDEHIFDAYNYVNELPWSVSAFFFIKGGCGDAYDGPKCEDYVRAAHATFLHHFQLTNEDVPLLRLDLFKKGLEPFSDDLDGSTGP